MSKEAGDTKQLLRAADIMTRDVVCLTEDLDLHECERLLLDRSISGAPVVDTDGNIRGVISKTDLVSYHADRGDEELRTGDLMRFDDARGAHVICVDTPIARDVMTPVPCVADESASIAELAALMVRREVHRIVICRGRRIVGIVSSMDILRALAGGHDTERATRKTRSR